MSVEPEPLGPQRLHWRSAERDRGMQEEHGFVWEALLETAAVDLSGRRVLDVGCNQGGFLRLVADRYGIAEGRGYDPAAGAVEVAKRLAGGRALDYVVPTPCRPDGPTSTWPSATRCFISYTTCRATLPRYGVHYGREGATSP